MLKLLATTFLTVLVSVTFAQIDTSHSINSSDTVRHVNRQRKVLPNLLIAEAFILGTSYYAAKPDAYGDKVIGWLYAGSSAAMLVYIPFYWTDKSDKLDSDFKKDRIWNMVTMVGLTYGFSRIATYNLLKSDGDNFNKRFKRNLIESHAAYFIPILTGALTEKLLFKNKPNRKVQSSLYFDGSNLHFAMTFK